MTPSGATGGSTRAGRPFAVLAPRALAEFILTCEHASCRLPPGHRPKPDERRILRTHWGWDPGAWNLTRALAARTSTAAIGGRWSRLWIDLNRRVEDPSSIRATVEGTRLSWNSRIGPSERERRILGCHAPYHEAIDRLIVRHLVRGHRPLLMAVHTFTPSLEGRTRPFDAGVLFERDGHLAQRLGGALRDAGLRVRYNEPYSGMAGMMYSIDRHGKHHVLPCLELEVNQALFLRPTSATRLARVVERGLRSVGRLRAAAGAG